MHMKVFKTIALTQFRSQKSLEDNLLIKKAELKNVIWDLEELDAIEWISSKLDDVDFTYQVNLKLFEEKLNLILIKIFTNLLKIEKVN